MLYPVGDKTHDDSGTAAGACCSLVLGRAFVSGGVSPLTEGVGMAAGRIGAGAVGSGASPALEAAGRGAKGLVAAVDIMVWLMLSCGRGAGAEKLLGGKEPGLETAGMPGTEGNAEIGRAHV